MMLGHIRTIAGLCAILLTTECTFVIAGMLDGFVSSKLPPETLPSSSESNGYMTYEPPRITITASPLGPEAFMKSSAGCEDVGPRDSDQVADASGMKSKPDAQVGLEVASHDTTLDAFLTQISTMSSLSQADALKLANLSRDAQLSVGTKILWAVSCALMLFGILLMVPWK